MGEEEPKKPEEEPKIVVDEDWKAQAEAEKERLAAQEDAAPADAAADGGAADAGRGELPPASFITLLSNLVVQARMALGSRDPQTNRVYRDLALAKHHIDTLAMLEGKTRGNLSDEEQEAFDNALYEARMAYVQAAQGGA